MTSIITNRIRKILGDRLQENIPLSRYTSARVGGSADGLVEISSCGELSEIFSTLQAENFPCKVIGGGSNLLISDDGYRGIILVNKASDFHFEISGSEIYLSCESGINLGSLARRAALEGFSGLEWACGIPGSLGGAIYGNAGAHGSDMSTSLIEAEILIAGQEITHWKSDQMEYGYRTSRLKRSNDPAVILRASIHGQTRSVEDIRAVMDEFTKKRKASQPTGASLGSIFKNPEGDYAGRLLESAGLKGTRIGGVEISTKHANFFINDASASASDIYRLIRLAQKKVMDQTGIELETEIELLGFFKDGE